MFWTDIPSHSKDCPKLVQEWLSSSDLVNFDIASFAAFLKTLGCEDFKDTTSFSMLQLSVDPSGLHDAFMLTARSIHCVE